MFGKAFPVMDHSNLVYVKRVKVKGRGVFARKPIAEGAVIERVPVILMPISLLVGGLDNPLLAKFVFYRNRSTVALALGYGSLYNHSFTPNALYRDEAGATMVYVALRNIAPGEEITINYNGDPADHSAVGFEVV
jgi:SET domain-containing protein